jgi:hypothetical protein
MTYGACEACKILLDKAAYAIAAHAKAIALLADGVKSNPETGLTALESEVRATRIVHEFFVTLYEEHRAYHELAEWKTMAAGSSASE